MYCQHHTKTDNTNMYKKYLLFGIQSLIQTIDSLLITEVNEQTVINSNNLVHQPSTLTKNCTMSKFITFI